MKVECVTSCIMSGNEAVCAAKGCCKATACLAGAYALARNTVNVVKGLQGGKVVQCAYVDCLGTCAPNCQFFANEVVLGATGIEKNLGIPELSKFENCLLCNCLSYVRNEIARAVWLVYTMCQQCSCAAPCTPCPSECFAQPVVPCVPPNTWTCDYPDACRDEYLASICREMTCRCGSTELCWRPRDFDFETPRATRGGHLMVQHGDACTKCRVPKSVRMEQQIRDRARAPPNVC
ncbi:unnamed protein product, partial [Iphiclides podalirius]